jgi:hypothetical protein
VPPPPQPQPRLPRRAPQRAYRAVVVLHQVERACLLNSAQRAISRRPECLLHRSATVGTTPLVSSPSARSDSR